LSGVLDIVVSVVGDIVVDDDDDGDDDDDNNDVVVSNDFNSISFVDFFV
jgi:hypothetical protein